MHGENLQELGRDHLIFPAQISPLSNFLLVLLKYLAILTNMVIN